MSEDKTGGPAFARPASEWDMKKSQCGCMLDQQDGMTLLDYFAGQALAGIVDHMTAGYRLCHEKEDRKRLATNAYDIAVDMLAEKNRREQDKE